jgi:hypothetical protein
MNVSANLSAFRMKDYLHLEYALLLAVSVLQLVYDIVFWGARRPSHDVSAFEALQGVFMLFVLIHYVWKQSAYEYKTSIAVALAAGVTFEAYSFLAGRILYHDLSTTLTDVLFVWGVLVLYHGPVPRRPAVVLASW